MHGTGTSCDSQKSIGDRLLARRRNETPGTWLRSLQQFKSSRPLSWSRRCGLSSSLNAAADELLELSPTTSRSVSSAKCLEQHLRRRCRLAFHHHCINVMEQHGVVVDRRALYLVRLACSGRCSRCLEHLLTTTASTVLRTAILFPVDEKRNDPTYHAVGNHHRDFPPCRLVALPEI